MIVGLVTTSQSDTPLVFNFAQTLLSTIPPVSKQPDQHAPRPTAIPMQDITHPLRGIVLILCAAVLWGTTGTAQSFAPLALSSYWIGATRLLVAGAFFILWLGLTDSSALNYARLRELPWPFITMAALCMAAYNLAFFAGVRATSVAIGTAIALGSGPLWAGIFQTLVSRQLPARNWWISVLIAISGLIIATVGSEQSMHFTLGGISLCLASGIAYAVYAMATKRIVTQAPPGVTTAAVFTIAAVIAVPCAWLLAGTPQLKLADISVMLWLGVFATGIAYLLFSSGLRFVSSATGVALALAEPIAAVCFAIVIVGERPGTISLLGIGIMLVGLGLLIRMELNSSDA